jgi:type IV pilus assembly protein PilM
LNYKNKLLDYFGILNDPIIGIDISSSAIKILQISKGKTNLRVDNYAIEPLRPGDVTNSEIKNKIAVIEAISTAMKNSDIHSTHVAISIPSTTSVMRVIQMPAHLKGKDLREEITIEADKYLPYSIDQVNMDYEIIGKNIADDKLVDILLVAAKVELIDERVLLLEQIGLIPTIIDVDSLAEERAFFLVINQLPESEQNKIVSLVDIGATSTSMTIFDKKKSVYNRVQAFGGQQLLEEIQARYGLTLAEARIAIRLGELPEDYMTDVLQPFKEKIAQEISHAFQYFFSSGDYATVDYIFLTGGTTSIAGLDYLIESKLTSKTSIVSPFTNMEFGSKVNKELLMKDATTLMTCCGLALRNCDI